MKKAALLFIAFFLPLNSGCSQQDIESKTNFGYNPGAQVTVAVTGSHEDAIQALVVPHIQNFFSTYKQGYSPFTLQSNADNADYTINVSTATAREESLDQSNQTSGEVNAGSAFTVNGRVAGSYRHRTTLYILTLTIIQNSSGLQRVLEFNLNVNNETSITLNNEFSLTVDVLKVLPTGVLQTFLGGAIGQLGVTVSNENTKTISFLDHQPIEMLPIRNSITALHYALALQMINVCQEIDESYTNKELSCENLDPRAEYRSLDNLTLAEELVQELGINSPSPYNVSDSQMYRITRCHQESNDLVFFYVPIFASPQSPGFSQGDWVHIYENRTNGMTWDKWDGLGNSAKAQVESFAAIHHCTSPLGDQDTPTYCLRLTHSSWRPAKIASDCQRINSATETNNWSHLAISNLNQSTLYSKE